MQAEEKGLKIIFDRDSIPVCEIKSDERRYKQIL